MGSTHLFGQLEDPVDVFSDLKIAERSVDLGDIGRRPADLLHLGFVAAVFFHQAKAVFGFAENAFGADDGVPDALPGDARVLRDLRKGEILVVVQVKKLPLLFGQQRYSLDF